MPDNYRPNVGIMLINKSGKVFMAARKDVVEDAWQMPQGGIDEGEDVLKAALRELEEETSIKSVEAIAISKEWLFYDFPPNSKFWRDNYKGQKQKWVLLKLIGDETEINLNTKEPEFKKHAWFDLSQVPELIVEFKRDIYKQIVAEFKDIIKNTI